MISKSEKLATSIALVLGIFQTAHAHTSFTVNSTTGNAYAGATYFATMNVGHGCEVEGIADKFDTEILEVEIPTSLQPTTGSETTRPTDATWGKASVIKTGSYVSKLVWSKAAGVAPESSDSNLYRVNFSVKIPAAPWTTLAISATQTCHNGSTLITHAWDGSTDKKPKATLNILPTRLPGWNTYTIPAGITLDLITVDSAGKDTAGSGAAFFKDALIVWSGDAAYSPNTETAKRITNKLRSIAPGSVIWVKY